MSQTPPQYPKYTGNEPCRSTDPEAFYPEQNAPWHDKVIKNMCGSCEMQADCAEWGIWYEVHGYWGGLNPRERRLARRRRNIRMGNELRQSVA